MRYEGTRTNRSHNVQSARVVCLFNNFSSVRLERCFFHLKYTFLYRTLNNVGYIISMVVCIGSWRVLFNLDFVFVVPPFWSASSVLFFSYHAFTHIHNLPTDLLSLVCALDLMSTSAFIQRDEYPKRERTTKRERIECSREHGSKCEEHIDGCVLRYSYSSSHDIQ